GVVLYRMATGRLPFQGRTTFEVLTSLATRTPDAPQVVNFNIPPELSDLILQLLEKNPAKRPPSAAGVAQALAAIEVRLTQVIIPEALPVNRPDPWADIDVTEPAPQLSPAPAVATQSTPTKAGAKSKGSLIAAAVALLVLIGGGFAAYQ